jgi:membrane protease YdiL (CAAX protease family)
MSGLDLSNVHVDALGWLFVVVIGVFMPAAVVRSSRRAKPAAKGHQKFTKRLRNVVILVGLAAVALVVARRDNIMLFPAFEWTPRLIVSSIAVLVGVVALAEALLLARSPDQRRELWARQIIPGNNAERAVWLVSATVAGATEEIIFRGVLFALLAAITGSVAAAAVVSALVFALAHYRQGWKSMAFIAPTALLFQWLVIYSGSLVPAIIVHAIYNIVRGMRASWSYRAE